MMFPRDDSKMFQREGAKAPKLVEAPHQNHLSNTYIEFVWSAERSIEVGHAVRSDRRVRAGQKNPGCRRATNPKPDHIGFKGMAWTS